MKRLKTIIFLIFLSTANYLGLASFNSCDSLLKQLENNVNIQIDSALSILNSYETKENLCQAKISFKKGIIYYRNSEFEKAIKYYLEANRIFQTINDSSGLSSTLDMLGIAYKKQGEYELAIKKFGDAILYSNSEKDSLNRSSIINNLGVCYEVLGKYDLALKNYNISLKIKSIYNDTIGMAYTYENIAGIYSHLDLIDSAKYYMNNSLKIKKNANDIWSYAIALNNMGEVLQKSKDFSQAILYYNESIEFSSKIGYKDLWQHSLKLLSICFEERKEFKKALLAYKTHSIIKDSIFNESKSKEIGKIEAQHDLEKKIDEEKRVKEIEEKLKNENLKRKNNLQYSGIFMVLLLLFTSIIFSNKFSVTERVAEGLIFFTFLLFFEFLLVLLDPQIENFSQGEPAYKLSINAVLAAGIFPLHSFFENKLKKKIKFKN